MTPTVPFSIRGENLLLDHRKAVFFPQFRTLVVADVHAGKVGHFRKSGIPVPNGVLEQDLAVLDSLMADYLPQTLVFAGDLFHSSHNAEWTVFETWLATYPAVEKVLTVGNHDILPVAMFESAGLRCVDAFTIGSLEVRHAPPPAHPGETPAEKYVLAGHLHPGIRLRGSGRQGLTLPCFYFGKHFGILPAFGRFTGFKIMSRKEGDSVFAIADGTVWRG